ncbi:MAG TPA: phospholipase D-like domain-containing protein, partial [Ktedonobacteraceae bacterium]|nr:phospholipase D-like domain-containing protein [Ktedonobacteraceae bacterium]
MLSSVNKPSYKFLVALLLLLFCVLFSSCSTNITLPADGSAFTSCQDTTCTPSASTSSQGVGTGAQGVKVFVEPDAGSKVITDAINQAQKSVWLEMYLLTNRNVITALEETAHRNIDVRVMLEAHPYGGGSVSPTETLDTLHAAGVKTKTTSPDFALTHEKGMIIDGTTAFITTANFTLAALGDSKSTKNREYGIIDTDPQDVQTVITIFNADWNRSSLQQIDAPNLVVSPIDSRKDFLTLIGSAKKSLSIEAEEMQDTQIEQALSDAANHGIQVQVILPKGSSSDSNGKGITAIERSGVQVKESSKLYMHAKIIIVDGQQAFVGSENISTASLNRNRELGIIVSDAAVLNTLQSTFQ